MVGLLDILQRLTTPDYGGGLLGQSGGQGYAGGGILGGGESPLAALSRGLLAASGPSPYPVGIGQALGSGLQAMDDARKENVNNVYRTAQMRSALATGALDTEKLNDTRQDRAMKYGLIHALLPHMSIPGVQVPDGGLGESSPDMSSQAPSSGFLGQSPITPPGVRPAGLSGTYGSPMPTTDMASNLPAATPSGGIPMNLPAATASSGAASSLPAATAPASAGDPLSSLDPDTRNAVMWDLALNDGKGIAGLVKPPDPIVAGNALRDKRTGKVIAQWTDPAKIPEGMVPIDPQDPNKGFRYDPNFIRGQDEMRAAGAPRTNFMMPQQTSWQRGMGDYHVGLYKDASTAAQDAQSQMGTLGAMQKLQDAVQTGALSPAMMKAGNWAMALKINPKSLGLPSNVGAMEALDMLSKRIGMANHKMIPGAISNYEDQILQTTVPRLGDTGPGFALKTKILQAQTQRSIQYFNAMEQWRQSHEAEAKASGSDPLMGFEQSWNQYAAQNPAVPPDVLNQAIQLTSGANGGGWGNAAPSAAPQAGAVPRVSTDAQYNALPSGTPFLDPKGKMRRKP